MLSSSTKMRKSTQGDFEIQAKIGEDLKGRAAYTVDELLVMVLDDAKICIINIRVDDTRCSCFLPR